jgi:hypothetical protein
VASKKKVARGELRDGLWQGRRRWPEVREEEVELLANPLTYK